jgi:LuxR family maltose regulon positive regulatory protein
MAKTDALLRHQITPPVFDPKAKLHRERLVDAIHANIPRKLIAIAAPPGYGKTTLLADFAANTELPVCWVRLTEADKDVMRLATVLAASLKRRFRRLRGRLDPEALVGTPPEGLANSFIDAIDSYVGETFVVVLDDVHFINRSPSAIAFVDNLVVNLPDQATILTAGREVLEVSLARLMAEGDLGGFGPHDLTFTSDEVADLARLQSDTQMGSVEAESLVEETRGWITGILLSGSLDDGGIASVIQSPRPMVYEYLAAVVLNRQPDPLRRFMLDASVLPVMTGAACDAVLQRKDSSRYLTRLVKEGLFVAATDESPRTYEFHPQFRKFLLESLSGADQKRTRRLRLRAASYLAKNGSVEDAVDLYLDAGAASKAAALADRHAGAMFSAGHVQTLETWAKRLDSLNMPAPYVFLYLARARGDLGDLEGEEAGLDRALSMLEEGENRSFLCEVFRERGHIALDRGNVEEALSAVDQIDAILPSRGWKVERSAALRLRALAMLRGRVNIEQAESLAQEAVRLLGDAGDDYALSNALSTLSVVKEAMGKPLEANAASLRAHEILKQIGAPFQLSVSFNNLAVDAHIRGEFEDALELYNEALKRARQSGSRTREANILFGQADLFSDLDLPLQAAELYGQGLTLATRIDHPGLILEGCLHTSVLHRRRGGVNLAYEWLRRAIAVDEERSPSILLRIQRASLELTSSPKNAQASLQAIIADESRFPDASERTLAMYMLARAYLADGEIDRSAEAMSDCVEWAAARGSLQVIAAELSFDEEFREASRAALGGSSEFAIVLQRIDMMRAIARQYREAPEERRPGVQVSFTGLGGTLIRCNGSAVTDLKPLAREVMFYVVDSQQIDRDVLVENFWPHHPPGRQTANLHMAIYALRRSLGKDVVQLEGTIYAINPEITVEYDVGRFERAAEVADGLPRGDPRRFFALTEAINAYGGAFLPEFTSDWVISRRRGLELRYLDLLATHAEEALVRDQPQRAVGTLRRALEIDPYRDDLNRQFMEALGRLGRRSEIVSHYQRYVRLMADELGLDPSPSMRETYDRLIS